MFVMLKTAGGRLIKSGLKIFCWQLINLRKTSMEYNKKK